jgi:hypothetical protein
MSSAFSSNSCRSFLNPFPSRGRLRDSLRARLREACKFLALASFGGSPYSLDDSGVVKCVLKAGCAVGTRMQIADNNYSFKTRFESEKGTNLTVVHRCESSD